MFITIVFPLGVDFKAVLLLNFFFFFLHFDLVMSVMSEKTPLLHYRLSATPDPKDVAKGAGTQSGRGSKETRSRKLGVMFGVVTPTLLSMFSVVVFLRIGESRRNTKQ